MSSANVELVRKAIEAWNRGDVDAMPAASVSDFEFVPAIAGTVDEGGSVRGADGFRRFVANLDETWDRFRIDAEELGEIGDRVLVVGRVRAKGRGSGIELDQPLTSVCRCREGRLASRQSFLGHDAALEAASREVVA